MLHDISRYAHSVIEMAAADTFGVLKDRSAPARRGASARPKCHEIVIKYIGTRRPALALVERMSLWLADARGVAGPFH